MKTEKVKLSQVKVNSNNPRTIREQKLNLLVERLLVFPKMIAIRPVVVDDKMIVLGGNMRVNALNRIAKMSFEQIAQIIGKTKNYQRLTQGEKEQLLQSWQEWLGKPTVEIVRASDLSEAEKKEFIIADNASFGEWDFDKLANEWDASDLNSWGVDVWSRLCHRATHRRTTQPTLQDTRTRRMVCSLTALTYHPNCKDKTSILTTCRR